MTSTTSNSALSINVGITGHRDIPNVHKHVLEEAVIKELKRMRTKYPNTTINVLCGLAEGADQIIASAALANNFNVMAVLPFVQSIYEQDFETPQAISKFRALLAQCSDVLICNTEKNENRNEGYIELGRTLVRCCDIVFAVWDGVTVQCKETGNNTPLPGGTADVVHMCVDGIMDDNSLLFSKPNQTYCKWLVMSQSKHTELPESIVSSNEIGKWKKLPIKGNQDESILKDILGKIEKFNLDSKTIGEKDKAKSISYLLGSVSEKENVKDLEKLINVYSLADCLAQARQQQRLTSLRFITLLSLIAIAAQQIYAGVYSTLGWFATHIVLISVIVGIYRLFFAGGDSKEAQFVEWRVFAENLRVQIFWHIAGLPDNCANNFRTTKLNEMDWIVDNLNKLSFNLNKPKKSNIEFVKTRWIADQSAYFNGTRNKTGRAADLLMKAKQYKVFSIFFFVSALILMIFSAFKIQFQLIPFISDDALFFIIAMLFISSALVKTFSIQMGFEELSHRYTRTGYFFQQALKRTHKIENQCSPGSREHIEKCQGVIKTIGIEALSENAAWLQLYKMNAYQVQIN
ncbi:hypothetical protein [Glaciecola sp. KUL10]|uniref:hypothetical protein n=1 Tax=Glaciecola sp. (strain KUL10) TaxID=2161813 RepID=UPI000D789E20|nr:hypothetical protein [Glaciecola sp. KUL10]GBL03421.1 hypothetical protein KUL10_07090 [Glaciecola sp. KUL10]